MHNIFLTIIALMGVILLSSPVFAEDDTTAASSTSQPAEKVTSNDEVISKDQTDIDSSDTSSEVSKEQLVVPSEEQLDKSSIENMLPRLAQLKKELQATITYLNKEMESLATENAETLTPNQSEMIETDLFKQEAKLQRMLRDINTQIDYLKALLEPKEIND